MHISYIHTYSLTYLSSKYLSSEGVNLCRQICSSDLFPQIGSHRFVSTDLLPRISKSKIKVQHLLKNKLRKSDGLQKIQLTLSAQTQTAATGTFSGWPSSKMYV